MDLHLCFASVNYYLKDDLPKAIGVSDEIKPKGGIMGELERMALHDPSIGKSKRSETPKVVSAVAN